MGNHNKLFEVIASALNVDSASINDDSSPDTVAGWDSTAMVHLVMELEQVFNER